MLTGYENNGEKNYDKVLECLPDKDINVIKKSKQRVEIDELYNNEFMPKEFKTYVMIDLYSRELQYGFIKQINDKYGHSDGDFAISTCASALDEVLPEGIAGRIGGDEFLELTICDNGVKEQEFRKRNLYFLRKMTNPKIMDIKL